MINIKRFICVFVCIVLMFSVSFSSFAVAGETDADYIKGVISSLATICGFQFDDWEEAHAFSNYFYNKILDEQTESQLSFLASIPNDFHSTEINNNFVGVDVNAALISSFLSALIEAFSSVSFVNGVLSGHVDAPFQYYWGENVSEFVNGDYVFYTLDDNKIDLHSLHDGLNVFGKNPTTVDKAEPIYYIFKSGDECFICFSVGNHFFRYNHGTYNVNTIRYVVPCFGLYKQSVLDNNTLTQSYDYLTFDEWNPFGGFDNTNVTYSRDGFGYFICVGFITYDLENKPKNFKLYKGNYGNPGSNPYSNFKEMHVSTEEDLNSIFNLSDNAHYSLYELWESDIIFENVSTPGTIPWAKRGFYSNYEILEPIFSGTDFGIGYNIPIQRSETELYAFNFYAEFIYALTFSYAFNNSIEYGIGSVLFDSCLFLIDSNCTADSDSLYNQIQDESLLVRVPINLDRLSKDESVTLKPDIEDIPWDGSSTEGGSDEDNPGTGSGAGGDNPFDSPDLDDSTVLDFLNDFIEGPKKFFKFLSDMWASLPNEISYVVMGSLVLCVGIGAVKLVI